VHTCHVDTCLFCWVRLSPFYILVCCIGHKKSSLFFKLYCFPLFPLLISSEDTLIDIYSPTRYCMLVERILCCLTSFPILAHIIWFCTSIGWLVVWLVCT